VLLKVKLDSRVKGSWFGVRPKAIWSCALKVRKGTVASGWTNQPRCLGARVVVMVAQRRCWKGPFLRVSLNRPVSTSRRLSLSESWRALAGCGCFRFGGGNQTIANSSLAGDLASAANSFRFLPHFSFRRLFIGGPELHLSEYSLALHFFLQKFQRLIDVIVADCNEQNISNSDSGQP